MRMIEAISGLYDLIRQGKKDRACQVWAELIGKLGQDIEAALFSAS